MKTGKLFVISGPSGVGKGTLVKEILKETEDIDLSISATTRDPREREKNGVDYYFYTPKEFEKGIEDNKFLEYAKVHGNYYGTLRSQVQKKLDKGKDIILEIDVQGGMQVKENFSDAVLIFLKPPSEEELERRLKFRATDSEEAIQKRLGNSLKEMEYEDRYDYSIVNDELSKAITELKEIINSCKIK